MFTKPRTILVLTGIFVAGAVSGVFLAPVLRFRGHAPMHRPFQERGMERLEHALDLTTEQRSQVAELMRQTGLELEKQRREAWRGSAALIDDLNARIAAQLTPEQRVKFETYRNAQRERLHRRFGDRDPRRHHGPGSMPSPGETPPPDGMNPDAERHGELPPPPDGPPPDMPPDDTEPAPPAAPQN